MNAIHQVIILVRNTLLVTLAVAGGFTLGSAIGIPSWLQVVCLIPAGYLFVRLSGDPTPPMKRWASIAIATTAVMLAITLAYELIENHFPSLDKSFWPFSLIFIVTVMPVGEFAAFIERHWPFKSADTSAEMKTP